MATSSTHTTRTAQQLFSVVDPATAHQQIKFYFNDTGKPVGYVVWAFLAKEAQNRFLRTKNFELHVSEWDEGDALWIIDLLAPFGHIKYILRDLRDNLFPEQREITYYRQKNGEIIFKQMSRDSHSFFLSQTRKVTLS